MNKLLYFKGIITGSATEDNARVIRENRFAMAAVGDESGIQLLFTLYGFTQRYYTKINNQRLFRK